MAGIGSSLDCGRGVILRPEVHVSQHPVDAQQVAALREALLRQAPELVTEFSEPSLGVPPGEQGYLVEDCLWRYLVARQGDVKAACAQLIETLKWRSSKRPDLIRAAEMEHQAVTGKVSVRGKDRHGRPIIVLDNERENIRDIDEQMRFLAWNMERATRAMGDGVHKYLVFIHLENFSIWNAPPMRCTRETLRLMQQCFAERLGHIVLFRGPAYFKIFFNAIKMFIDAKTVSKAVFVTGNASVVAEGSADDSMLKQLIGDDWKVLCGVEQPQAAPDVSIGYDHPTYWSAVVEEESAWVARVEQAKSESAGAAAAAAGAAASPPAPPALQQPDG